MTGRNKKTAPFADANRALFQCVAWLIAVVIFLTGALTWLALRPLPHGGSASFEGVLLQAGLTGQNIVRAGFPEVDFRPLYPGYSDAEIDQIQRETFSVRYVYAPFVQFRGLPMNTKYVQLTADGVRLPGHSQPWPPRREDFVVFVFGGSTVFGNNLAPTQTVPARIESELRSLYPSANVVVYNLGCGYYFSSQERVLFNTLLERRIQPDIAIFIDGLNDFLTPLGIPKFTREFFRHTAPDLEIPAPPKYENDSQRNMAMFRLLQRYQQNVKLIGSAAATYGVRSVFVGQPVPYFQYPRDETLYPFRKERSLDELCASGYAHFARLADQGSFGPRFVWAGDVFSELDQPAYSDSIHYSPLGASVLAQQIVQRAKAAGLLDPQDPLISAGRMNP